MKPKNTSQSNSSKGKKTEKISIAKKASPTNRVESPLLHKMDEELLERKFKLSGSQISEAEAQKLIDELAVHQIELKLQSDEL